MRLDDCSLPGVTAIIPYCVVLHRACPSWFPAKGAMIPTRQFPFPAAGNGEVMVGDAIKVAASPQILRRRHQHEPHTHTLTYRELRPCMQPVKRNPGRRGFFAWRSTIRTHQRPVVEVGVDRGVSSLLAEPVVRPGWRPARILHKGVLETPLVWAQAHAPTTTTPAHLGCCAAAPLGCTPMAHAFDLMRLLWNPSLRRVEGEH